MGAPATNTSNDDGSPAVRGPWIGIGLLMAANVLLLAGLTFWTDMPFPLKVGSGVLGMATVVGTGWFTIQIARHLWAEVREKERNARRMSDAEARARSILETAGDGIIAYDPEGRIRLFNKAAARIFDYQPEEVIGTKIWDLIHGQTGEGAKLGTDEVVVLDKGGVVEGRRRDGTNIPLEPALSKVRVEGGVLSILVLRDLTERKRAEEELHRARAELTHRVRERTAELEQANARLEARHAKLEKAKETLALEVAERKRAEADLEESERRRRALAHQLLEAQESERRHLAQELHDEVGQTLTAIKITLQSALRLGAAEAGPLLEDCIQLAEKTLAQVRKLSVDLRPASLDRLGLVPSIRGLLDREAQRIGLVAHFESDVSSGRWRPDLETACFRIVQEALTNVVRHAQASLVRVSIHEGSSELYLCIQDDGVGFQVAEAHERAARGKSLGLLGLHERVQLLGGRLEIDSRPGHGTTIEVHVPLTAQDRNPQLGVSNDGSDSGPAG